MPTDIKDLYWLAGLLEGEGCFTFSGNCPMVQIQMTDLDVIQRAAKIMDTMIGARRRPTQGGLTAHFTQAAGSRAMAVMMTVYPLMGERRKERIRELIARWQPSGRLQPEQVSEMRTLYANGHSAMQIAQRFGIRYERAWRVIRGDRWRSHPRGLTPPPESLASTPTRLLSLG